MDIFLELLKYILPALIVFLTTFYIVRKFFENDQKQKKFELMTANQKITTPIKLQAYERIILFLERISPESIIMRINTSGMNVKMLQEALHEAIRAEFEHNLSQQVYISPKAWEMVKNAKGNLLKLINTVADSIDGKSPSINLSQAILEKVIEMKKSPVYDAIEYVKSEVQEIIK